VQALQFWRDYRRIARLPMESRRIVVYSEGSGGWVHLAPIVRALTEDLGRSVCYISSQPSDIGLHQDNSRILPFCVGEGLIRTLLFNSIEATVMVMTTPDLETFHLKRSGFPVHYVYVHHSMVSTHMVYRPGAFDHFDTIFCVGPHHASETRESEEIFGTSKKNLFEHGYGHLDEIMSSAGAGTAEGGPSDVPTILVAPSWGPDGLLETAGQELVHQLLSAGFKVTVRPHPRTRMLTPSVIKEIERKFGGHYQFHLDNDVASHASMHTADLMISDWSGAALEFAFGLERPVLFVDVPRKVNNPQYVRYDAVPLEVLLRDALGAVVAPDRLTEIPDRIKAILREPDATVAKIKVARQAWVFNPGRSGQAGAAKIAELADEIAGEQAA
jgi:hypothetical protein